MRASTTPEFEQMDFTGLLFPGRKSLYVSEVAERLGATDQHVINLIDEGKLGAIDIGNGSRKFYRIPVTEWERFLKRRATL
ncbi:MAG TPA: helix-turn-helix domain-containing protein [Candidatus Limnocylindrales bacterium]|nr:helix-turn-helix domain-containing protein [Candidatus Limnocylindrales bacterium]